MDHRYAKTLQYLYDNLPMFQRIGPAAIKKDLTNTVRLCERLGNPQKRFRCVHVAGTNGKGSSSHFLASILFEAGYKVGLYTSPHLKEFTERIRVNGREVTRSFVVDFVTRMRPVIDEIKPSFFEITVAMAFDYFASESVDVAVVEVGMGGRLDSTNIITPEVSLITNIGWDHKELLGDTLPAIAAEKAGIIKPGVPVVVSEEQEEVADVFTTTAEENHSDLYFASRTYRVVPSGDCFTIFKNGQAWCAELEVPLKGIYQRKNLPGVACAAEVLNDRGFTIDPGSFSRGIRDVIKNTALKGRWQVLTTAPLMICDTAHNAEGIREVVSQIAQTHCERVHIVLGVVKDKDVSGILSLMPKQATYYFCQSKIPRAMEATLLSEKARDAGLHGEIIPDVNEAKNRALMNASSNDLIFIGGSTFVVAEIDEL